jgi:hypothetical protein
MDKLGLEPEMTYRVRTTDPLTPTEGSPLGTRQYWQVTEASLEGDRIRWLNTSLLVASGRLLGTGRIEYAVFRVT